MVVSPDGNTCKTILSKADGFKLPDAIDIHKETGMMIVSRFISEDSRIYETVLFIRIEI